MNELDAMKTRTAGAKRICPAQAGWESFRDEKSQRGLYISKKQTPPTIAPRRRGADASAGLSEEPVDIRSIDWP
jgi:hypothetical protein